MSAEHVLLFHVLGLLELFLAQRYTFLESVCQVLPEIFRHWWIQAAPKDKLRNVRFSTDSLRSVQCFTHSLLQLDHLHFERLIDTCLLYVHHEDCLLLVDPIDCVFD